MNLTLDHRTPACPVLGLSGRVMPGPLSCIENRDIVLADTK
mgnify:FL=1|jgi:hypothetical protein